MPEVSTTWTEELSEDGRPLLQSIATFTGRRFWPLDPRIDDIDIRDIAHALSLKCRFTGHCRVMWSIAQHSIHVSEILPPRLKLWGLLHDASEAYLPDVASPIKNQIHGFREIENRLLKCIALRFGLDWPIPEEVHAADVVLYVTERRDLMAPISEQIDIGRKNFTDVTPLPNRLTPFSNRAAEHEFLNLFEDYSEVVHAG